MAAAAAAAAAAVQTFKRNFTDLEWKAIWEAGESEEEQQDCFRCHWSLKEAFTKARGDGIAFDLSRCVRAPSARAPAAITGSAHRAPQRNVARPGGSNARSGAGVAPNDARACPRTTARRASRTTSPLA